MLPTTYDTTGTNRTRCMEYEGNFGNVTDCNLKDQLCAKITIGKLHIYIYIYIYIYFQASEGIYTIISFLDSARG